jgi:DNA-binding CsgD family transcriptional regulator
MNWTAQRPQQLLERGADLGGLISAIGRQQFDEVFLHYINDNCGADHVSVFEFDHAVPKRVATVSLDSTDTAFRQCQLYIKEECWRIDPAMAKLSQSPSKGQPSLHRLDVAGMPMKGMRDMLYASTRIRERVLLSGQGARGAVAVSILRTEKRGPFSGKEITKLTDIAGVILSVLERHCDMQWQSRHMASALSSLSEIEACCSNAPDRMPRREIEVCSRILYGLSTAGIALDLDIGEETVTTYRKRIYQRLAIASHRELLLWYIAIWSDAYAIPARAN